jgi:hypothetical protein
MSTNKFPNESLKIQAWINKENFHKSNNELSSKQFFKGATTAL